MSGPQRPSYTPLGVGATRPKAQDRVREANQAQAAFVQASQGAGVLFEALRDNPTLRPIWKELNQQLNIMMAENPVCAVLIKILNSYHVELDAPRIAEEKLRTVMGPVLMEAMSKEPASAP